MMILMCSSGDHSWLVCWHFVSEPAVILLSEIVPLPIPRSKSTHTPIETQFTFAQQHIHNNYCNMDDRLDVKLRGSLDSLYWLPLMKGPCQR